MEQMQSRHKLQERRSSSGGDEFGTALAIVPGTADWDRIQRARHYAHDPVFHSFPPCIRLFHPFKVSSASIPASASSSSSSTTTQRASFDDHAFDIAQLVEDLDIEPFAVTFDTWTIIPLLEVWEHEYKHNFMDHDDDERASSLKRESEAEREVRELIERETESANKKAGKRRQKLRKKKLELEGRTEHDNENTDADAADFLPLNGQQRALSDSDSLGDDGTYHAPEKSMREIRDEQQDQMSRDEFGGSCILCLEPDEESKARLQDLREALREGLGHDSYSSPSSVYSWTYISDEVDSGIYRPLIPISKFDSFPAAMDVARRLKGLWGDPLTIQIRDLHLISCYGNDDAYASFDYRYESGMYPNTIFLSARDRTGSSHHAAAFSSDANGILQNQNYQRLSVESKDEVWGCNAKIMLMGEEMEQDDEENRDMVNKLLTDGQPGGGDMTDDFTILDDEDDSLSDLEQYLNDDNFDEGAQIVVGRVHFYTGEQRIYKGMPASSVIDAKDRSMGDNGMVSGAARRRGSIGRQFDQLKEGEFGRRGRDFLPWNTHERPQKEKGKHFKNFLDE
jgi:hypothetical protein